MSRVSPLLLALLAAAACAADQRPPDALTVVIFNNAVVDLDVEVASHRFVGIDSGTSQAVKFQKVQWINFGMIAHEYQLPADVGGVLRTSRVQFQAEADGKLYFVPADIELPASPLPAQPPGFPLEPTQIVDLT